MKVVVLEPGEAPVVTDARREPRRRSNHTVRSLEELVGGTPVTCLRFVDQERGIDLTGWCDDDGMSKGLPINFARPTDGAEIRGPVIITGRTYTKDGPDWGGLNDAELAEAIDLMRALGR